MRDTILKIEAVKVEKERERGTHPWGEGRAGRRAREELSFSPKGPSLSHVVVVVVVQQEEEAEEDHAALSLEEVVAPQRRDPGGCRPLLQPPCGCKVKYYTVHTNCSFVILSVYT